MEFKKCDELIEKFNKVASEPGQCVINREMGGGSYTVNMRLMYLHIFGEFPKRSYYLKTIKDKEDKLTFTDFSLETTPIEDRYVRVKSKFSFMDTCRKLGVTCFPVYREAYHVSEYGLIALETYGDVGDTEIDALSNVSIFTDTVEHGKILCDYVIDNLVEVKEDVRGKTKYIWVKTGYSGGFAVEELDFKKMEIDLKKNYNDDLPYNDILNVVNSQENELILFNGKPGTGKTTFIKHLMGVSENKFLYIDSSLLLNVDSSKFISFLLEYRNSVVVLEDCEKILSHRDDGNPFMGILLNLTDGIIGETVRAKFICSFNCSEDKIDNALLRKGRLSLKYTFNELSLEKTRAFIPDATSPQSLAEIYNKNKVNVVGGKVRKKIGF